MAEKILIVMLALLALCVVIVMVFVATHKHSTDRLIGINMLTTIILNLIVVLSLVLEATSIIDIDIVYALLSFLAVVVLCRMLRVRMLAQRKREEESAQ